MSAGTASSQAVKPSLTLKRRLNAAPEKVYAAWTNPTHLVKWFGPDSGPVTRAKTDVRVGGVYLIEFSTEDGEQHSVGGEYREVEQDRKLAFTWAWRTMPERESFVTVLIKPEADTRSRTIVAAMRAGGFESGRCGAKRSLNRRK